MIDATWALMLRDGRGGFIDYAKYRDQLTKMVWYGEMPEQSAEQKAAAIKDAVGKPPEANVLAAAKALRERLATPANTESD